MITKPVNGTATKLAITPKISTKYIAVGSLNGIISMSRMPAIKHPTSQTKRDLCGIMSAHILFLML